VIVVKEHVLLLKSCMRLRVSFHTKKPMTPRTATPPATDNPMMVDDETLELEPPEVELAAAGLCEELAVDDVDGESETTITLVTTWPPLVVTKAEVDDCGCCEGAAFDCAAELCAADEVTCCCAEVGAAAAVVEACCAGEAELGVRVTTCCCVVVACAAADVVAAAEELCVVVAGSALARGGK
jgi:hypothetical protein